MPVWDPQQYLRFAAERARPFEDLLARVGATNPRTVVDLGCGPGNLTRALAQRWPGARVHGLDSSEPMIAAARQASSGRLTFEQGDLRDWQPDEPVDVLISNATLQWIPDHLDLLSGWLDRLGPDGWLAVQVPGNFAEPSHVLLHELAATEPYAGALAGQPLSGPASGEPADYLRVLLDAGRLLAGQVVVDVWETTYLHVLPGPDPVLQWLSGTGARPILQALAATGTALADRFRGELTQLLASAYPPGPAGTVLPFRRIFAVAHRGGPA